MDNNIPTFKRGDKVMKISGYSFRGVVIAIYQKLNGEWRMDVEIPGAEFPASCLCINCSDPNGAGMIHIFNPDQFRKVQEN
jgi:hypothetical protein